MKSILSVGAILLVSLSVVSCRFELVNQWNGGWQGILHIDVTEDIVGWDIYTKFDIPIGELEVFKGHVTQNQGNIEYTIVNEPWDAELPAGSVFDLDFIVRYTPDTQVPVITAARINGVDVDLGVDPIPTGGTLPTTVGPTTTQGTTQTAGPTTTRAPGTGYDYGEVIGLSNLFYEAQRSGKLPASNRIPWRSDAFMGDKGDGGLDLTGGYFDAGDHVKFGFPFASFTTIIAWGLIDFKDGYVAAGEYENGLATLRWSLDYFMKAHPSPNEFYGQVGDGNADHAFWGRPEDWPESNARPAFKITESAPGSDLAGEASASLAAGYLVFKDSDPAYAESCLTHSKDLYNFANKFRGVYSDSITNAQSFYNSWSGYGDELTWAAAWLLRATNDAAYAADVKAHWAEFNMNGRPIEFGWDDKKAGVQVLLSRLLDDKEYKDAAQAFCDYIVNDVPRSPKGLAFISQWGALRHASNVAFVCLQAAEVGINTEVYRAFAKQQIDYILGDGGRSYVIGYGNNPPTRPHHRGSSCPNKPAPCDWEAYNSPNANPQTLYGALVGGPDASDVYEDNRDDYIKNEVATDYNAGFQSALAALNSLKSRGLIH